MRFGGGSWMIPERYQREKKTLEGVFQMVSRLNERDKSVILPLLLDNEFMHWLAASTYGF
jgi:hypothetical protein